jgi:hypothetical protein
VRAARSSLRVEHAFGTRGSLRNGAPSTRGGFGARLGRAAPSGPFPGEQLGAEASGAADLAAGERRIAADDVDCPHLVRDVDRNPWDVQVMPSTISAFVTA